MTDCDREYRLAEQLVRDLLQNMIDDVGSNGMLNENSTAHFQSIVYRLMDQL